MRTYNEAAAEVFGLLIVVSNTSRVCDRLGLRGTSSLSKSGTDFHVYWADPALLWSRLKTAAICIKCRRDSLISALLLCFQTQLTLCQLLSNLNN